MYTGATTLKTPGQGMEFYSLREYLPGDAFRMINWKAFARTGELMVNAGVTSKGSMPLQAVTNAMSSRISRGSPVFIISSLEGDGTTLPAIRNLAGKGHEVIVLSPSSIDLERLVSRIPRMSYEVLKLERQNRLTAISGYGAKVIDWMPDIELSQALLQVKTV